MKTLQKITRCKRCGDLLSAYEKSHTGNQGLCAFCDHMHGEVLEIYQELHAKNRTENNTFRLV